MIPTLIGIRIRCGRFSSRRSIDNNSIGWRLWCSSIIRFEGRIIRIKHRAIHIVDRGITTICIFIRIERGD